MPLRFVSSVLLLICVRGLDPDNQGCMALLNECDSRWGRRAYGDNITAVLMRIHPDDVEASV